MATANVPTPKALRATVETYGRLSVVWLGGSDIAHYRTRDHDEDSAIDRAQAHADFVNAEPDGSPDRPYRLRVERGRPALDVSRIRGAVSSFFGRAASRYTSITSRDGETYRASVTNLGPGSTCYVIEWRNMEGGA